MSKRTTLLSAVLAVFMLAVSFEQPANAGTAWRSSLYPTNWQPLQEGGSKDASGRFLHDFSFAGYQRGERSIPTNPPGNTYNAVTDYGADSTGVNDATAAIQNAIDAAGQAGGGVVYLPAGTYKVSPQSSANDYSLWISKDHVVLRGAGKNSTYLYNSTAEMRQKSVIKVAPAAGGDWHTPVNTATLITADLLDPVKDIPVASTAGYSVGDWIVVRADATDAFLSEIDSRWVGHGDTLKGPTFYRQIVKVDATAKIVTIDIPTRFYLKTRDNARIYKVAPSIREIGVESLSIGMRQSTLTGLEEGDYTKSGTAGYQVHSSNAIKFSHALNAWVNHVASYRPSVNSGDYHLTSNGIKTGKSRSISILNTSIEKPQYEGGGGNGYGFTLQGSDSLIQDSTAHHGRHNYDFQYMWTSGNVIHRSTSNNGAFASDFHNHLSMANMFDSMTVENDYLEGADRGTSGTVPHGKSTTESVFWNTKGLAYKGTRTYIVRSQQFGNGYVIGTQGAASGVSTNDFVEGVGLGADLQPQSLYSDQLSKRISVPAARDAYVRGGAYAGINYGSDPQLLVKRGTVADYFRESYLAFQFGAQASTVRSAILHFYVSDATSATPVTVYGLAEDSWTESGLTWNLVPSSTGAVNIGTVNVTGKGWYSIDVSDYTAGQLSDKTVTFRLHDSSSTNNLVTINSSNATENKPYMVIRP